MGLPPAFSLLHSEFNEFLFAAIGEEQNGVSLSVVSALTRLGIDPWREAARLSSLRQEEAVNALAPVIARFPGGRWELSDARGIAARLVALLPQARFTPGAATGVGRGKRNPRTFGWMTGIALALLALVAWRFLG